MPRFPREIRKRIQDAAEVAELCGCFFSASTIREIFPVLPPSVSKEIKRRYARGSKKRLRKDMPQARYIRWLFRNGFALTDILLAENYYTADVLRVLEDML